MKWDPRTQEWVEEYTPFEVKRAVRKAWLFLAFGLWVVVVILFLAFKSVAGEGGHADRPSRSSGTPSPVTPKTELDFERGLSAAIANIVATVPDPTVGKPRGEFILGNFQQMTGCTVEGVTVETTTTRPEARDLATKVSVIRAVEYAEPDWEDQFVVVTVEVACP